MKMFLLVVLSCVALAHAQHYYDVYPHARPYQVGYYARDPHRHQLAEETRTHAGHVAGRYGYLDARGVGRHVNYVANHGGLRADIRTNEPVAVSSVAAQPIVSRPVAVVAPASTFAEPVLGLVNGYRTNGYAVPLENYVYGNLGYRYGDVLGYSGLLGNYGNVVTV